MSVSVAYIYHMSENDYESLIFTLRDLKELQYSL